MSQNRRVYDRANALTSEVLEALTETERQLDDLIQVVNYDGVKKLENRDKDNVAEAKLENAGKFISIEAVEKSNRETDDKKHACQVKKQKRRTFVMTINGKFLFWNS